jgi:hypothetical protein
MPRVRYVSLFNIEEVTITFVRNADRTYDATLKAEGVSFHGKGRSMRTAVDDAFPAASKEPRGPEKGRPTKRYQVAQSITGDAPI